MLGRGALGRGRIIGERERGLTDSVDGRDALGMNAFPRRCFVISMRLRGVGRGILRTRPTGWCVRDLPGGLVSMVRGGGVAI